MELTRIPSESFYRHLKYNIGEDLFCDIKAYNGYIAGGSCRAWFANEEISDYDFFFDNEKEFEEFEEVLFKQRKKQELLKWHDDIEDSYKETYDIVFNSDNAISLVNTVTKAKIQLIKTRFTPIEEQIKVFDFSVCSIGFDLNNKEFLAHPRFFDDLKSKRLRLVPNQEGLLYPLAEIERIARYSRKGYKIKGVDIVYVILFIAQRLKNIHTYEDFKKEINGMDIALIDGIFEESSLNLDDDFNPGDLYDEIQSYLEDKR